MKSLTVNKKLKLYKVHRVYSMPLTVIVLAYSKVQAIKLTAKNFGHTTTEVSRIKEGSPKVLGAF